MQSHCLQTLLQMHRGVARILSRVDEEARSATRALANNLQWEYDDEYDDSFDDLNRSGGKLCCVGNTYSSLTFNIKAGSGCQSYDKMVVMLGMV